MKKLISLTTIVALAMSVSASAADLQPNRCNNIITKIVESNLCQNSDINQLQEILNNINDVNITYNNICETLNQTKKRGGSCNGVIFDILTNNCNRLTSCKNTNKKKGTSDTTQAATKPEIQTQTTTKAEPKTEATTQAATEKPTQRETKPQITTEKSTQTTTEKITQATTKSKPTTEKTTQATTKSESTTKLQPTTEKQTQQTTKSQKTTEKTTETTTSAPVSSNSEASALLALVNQARAENGLSPLTLNSSLSAVAQKKAEDMKKNNYFSHTSPTYGSPFDMMKNAGISYRTAGENIAKGQKDAQTVFNAWMNSSGHRANILNGNYTQMGLGVTSGSSRYWSQMFIG